MANKPELMLTPKHLRRMTNQVLRALKITTWDVLLVGDGSGTTSIKTGGWGCIAVENAKSPQAQVFYGGINHGSNIRCELLAYVFPLMHYAENAAPGTVIHVATDCKYIAQSGERKLKRNKHKALWAAVDTCRRAGIQVRWHWIPRDTYGLNKAAHTLANRSRVAIDQLQICATSEDEVARRKSQKH